ncbi:Vacuolar protein-sorting-associated protein 33-like protein [Bienertia sinuspersici]
MSFSRSVEEILKLLPGPHVETKRGALLRGSSLESLSGGLANADKAASGRRSVVLVVFIGGVTFAEISALRFLGSQELMAYDIIVATTKVVNGQTLLDPFVEKLS